jgi:hypothetical protein
MTTYLLKKFDRFGRPHGYGELQGVDEAEVVAWAAKLPGSFRYELWCEQRLVFQSDVAASANPTVPAPELGQRPAMPEPLQPGA